MDEASIFAAAARIQSEEERKAFLDQACGENAELRAEVEELLRASAAAGSFLNHPPADLGTDDTTELGFDKDSLTFLEPCDNPDRIGKLGVYEILGVVGRGGMGIVLRAWDTKLNRTVAIKVMAPELAGIPMAVKRFLSEAQKAAAVIHDHVVTIHAVDDAHRPPYLVMEFIEGQTLQQKIERHGATEKRPRRGSTGRRRDDFPVWPGYPSLGCTPAEPNSVLPSNVQCSIET
ncbi:MAG: protein kinase domain-containing protein [Thermoguttaceae bacterium]|jgi:serine/threonine protein kinase